jgi:hypothetical protein
MGSFNDFVYTATRLGGRIYTAARRLFFKHSVCASLPSVWTSLPVGISLPPLSKSGVLFRSMGLIVLTVATVHAEASGG